MKIKSSVKQICNKCKRIKRYKKFINICLYHPKHKHRQ